MEHQKMFYLIQSYMTIVQLQVEENNLGEEQTELQKKTRLE